MPLGFLSIMIVVFWLAMTALLIQREFFPSSTGLADIPLPYLSRQIWLHEQPSELLIVDNRRETVGYVRVQPKTLSDEPDAPKFLEAAGNIVLRNPFSQTQPPPTAGKAVEEIKVNFNLKGRFQRDGSLGPATLQFAFPYAGTQLELEIDRPTNTYRYSIRAQRELLDSGGGTLDLASLKNTIAAMGVDPVLLSGLVQAKEPHFSLRCLPSHLTLEGQTISTFRLSFSCDETELAELQFSALGQILSGSSPLGYSLQLPPSIR
jgi:hypothetical protein